jgi:hypothetical protein
MMKNDDIIGQRITGIRNLTPAELEKEGWENNPHHGPATGLELENGVFLYPSQDPEGNDSGTFFYSLGKHLHVIGEVDA